jgi:hypothetical protein
MSHKGVFLGLLALFLVGFSFAGINVSITTPTYYTSPELTFDTTVNVQNQLNDYVTSINIAVLNLSDQQESAYTYNNSNTSWTLYNYTKSMTVPSGNYRLNITVINNASATNNSIVEIYPRATLTQEQYQCTPPLACTYENFTHSNGQKFYIVSNNNSCTGLGLWQMNSNFKFPTYNTANVIPNATVIVETSKCNRGSEVMNRSYYGNNKEIGIYVNETADFSTSSARVTIVDAIFKIRFNLTGTQTQKIVISNLSQRDSTVASYGGGYFVILYLDNQTATASNLNYTLFFANGTNGNFTPSDVSCWLNTTGIYCSGGSAGAGGTHYTNNWTQNFSGRLLLFDVIAYTQRIGVSYTCPGVKNGLNVNFNVTNPTLNSYTGFQLFNSSSDYIMLGAGTQYGAANATLVSCPMNGSEKNINISYILTNITNAQPTVRLLLFYNSQVVYPYLYYIVNSTKAQMEATMGILNPNIYPLPSTITNAYNNSVTYIYSKELGNWFLIPPFDLVPSTSPYIANLVLDTGQINTTNTLSGNATYNYTIQNYTYLLGTTYSISPANRSWNTTFNITFNVSDQFGLWTNWGMKILRIYNGTTSTVYDSNSTNATGGYLNYTVNSTGYYQVFAHLQQLGSTNYQLSRVDYQFNLSSPYQNAIKTIQDPGFINGWTYYFFAVVVAMLVVGAVSRYTIDGAGIMGALVLWIFTLINPAAVITTVNGIAITTTLASILATILTVAILYLKQPW